MMVTLKVFLIVKSVAVTMMKMMVLAQVFMVVIEMKMRLTMPFIGHFFLSQ